MGDIKSIHSGFDNNILKLLISDLSKNGFVKSEPAKESNAWGIAHVSSPNWLLHEITLWQVIPSLEDIVSW